MQFDHAAWARRHMAGAKGHSATDWMMAGYRLGAHSGRCGIERRRGDSELIRGGCQTWVPDIVAAGHSQPQGTASPSASTGSRGDLQL